MPSKSQKQHNLMAMVANDPKAAKRVGVPQSVGQEFMKADKGKKFGSGAPRTRPDLQKINRKDTKHGKMELFSHGGSTKETEMKKMKTKRMMDGGMAGMQPPPQMPPRRPRPPMPPPEMMPPQGMKKGGKTSMGKVKTAAPSRDGVAIKGKTKGKMITMKRGGRTC